MLNWPNILNNLRLKVSIISSMLILIPQSTLIQKTRLSMFSELVEKYLGKIRWEEENSHSEQVKITHISPNTGQELSSSSQHRRGKTNQWSTTAISTSTTNWSQMPQSSGITWPWTGFILYDCQIKFFNLYIENSKFIRKVLAVPLNTKKMLIYFLINFLLLLIWPYFEEMMFPQPIFFLLCRLQA